MMVVTGVATAEFGGREGFSGSDSCRECHPAVYAQWRLTPHARMLVNAKRDPFSILADDFGNDIPFSPEDIDYTVGNHWVQKYLKRIDGDLYVLPKYWNVPKRAWEPYSIWNWRQKPYNIHCDGCHTVGFKADDLTFFEPGVGCESCHGPGKEHVETGGRLSAIVNPANLDTDRAQMVCMQCHTDGQDTQTETFPFPVNFVPGEDLTEYFSEFFMPKPKSKKWYWGSMDIMERKRMYYFFQSKFYSTNRACEVCGFDRGATVVKERYMTSSEYCGTCHKQRFDNFLEHSGHRETNTDCADCHVPSMSEPGKSYSIHDHKFNFDQAKPACTECHDREDEDDIGIKEIDEETGVVTWLPEPEHHEFHLKEIKYPREMTMTEACVFCHKEQTEQWAKERIPGLVDRFIVQ
jgi:hypothetical protein